MQTAEYRNREEVAVLGLDVSIAGLISMKKQSKCFRYSNVPQSGTHSSHWLHKEQHGQAREEKGALVSYQTLEHPPDDLVFSHAWSHDQLG